MIERCDLDGVHVVEAGCRVEEGDDGVGVEGQVVAAAGGGAAGDGAARASLVQAVVGGADGDDLRLVLVQLALPENGPIIYQITTSNFFIICFF